MSEGVGERKENEFYFSGARESETFQKKKSMTLCLLSCILFMPLSNSTRSVYFLARELINMRCYSDVNFSVILGTTAMRMYMENRNRVDVIYKDLHTYMTHRDCFQCSFCMSVSVAAFYYYYNYTDNEVYFHFFTFCFAAHHKKLKGSRHSPLGLSYKRSGLCIWDISVLQ